jgi:hypothetical protein
LWEWAIGSKEIVAKGLLISVVSSQAMNPKPGFNQEVQEETRRDTKPYAEKSTHHFGDRQKACNSLNF